jgi:ribonuclease Z
VRLLALTHFSTRYPVRLLRDEARAVFPATVLPRDFDTIEIPYIERGEPALVRWDARAEAEAAEAQPEAQAETQPEAEPEAQPIPDPAT